MFHFSPRTLAHRAIRAILVVTMVLVALVASTSAASAESVCKSGTGYANCFEITERAIDYEIYIGIDIYMSRQDAEAIISPPGEEFSATVMGQDTLWDNALFTVPVKGSWASDSGLSAEFTRVVNGSSLDEDWEGEDEVYGRIRLYDPRSRETLTFTTKVIHEYFHSYP